MLYILYCTYEHQHAYLFRGRTVNPGEHILLMLMLLSMACYQFGETDITGEMCLGAHIPQGNAYHCNTGFYYSNSGMSLGTRPHKGQTHNYVSSLGENSPAMARPAGLVLVPMQTVVYFKSMNMCLAERKVHVMTFTIRERLCMCKPNHVH